MLYYAETTRPFRAIARYCRASAIVCADSRLSPMYIVDFATNGQPIETIVGIQRAADIEAVVANWCRGYGCNRSDVELILDFDAESAR